MKPLGSKKSPVCNTSSGSSSTSKKIKSDVGAKKPRDSKSGSSAGTKGKPPPKKSKLEILTAQLASRRRTNSNDSSSSSGSSSNISALTDPEIVEFKSEFAENKEYQRSRLYSVVKIGISKICRCRNMIVIFEDCVRRCSIIAAEASILATMHILRLLKARYPQYVNEGDDDVPQNYVDEHEILPVLNDTFFNQVFSCIANLKGAQSTNNMALQDTLFRHYEPLKPEGYENVGRIECVMGQMLVIIAHQARQNFVVSTEATMQKRLLRWLDFKIRAHKVEGDYFSVYGAYNGKSIKALMLRACLEDVEVAVIMLQYKRIRENEVPIPDDELAWMQELCTEVKVALNITPEKPYDVGMRPEAYLPFLFRMLFELGEGEGGGEGDIHYRLFSLLPQKKIKPIYITINNTILKELHFFLDPTGHDHFHGAIDLWDYYFDLKSILRYFIWYMCYYVYVMVLSSYVLSIC